MTRAAAGSLGEAHQEPAVTTLEPGDCEGPAVAHHADPTVSFVVAALFAYSTLTAAAPLSEISPVLDCHPGPKGLQLQSRPDAWLRALCHSHPRSRESFQHRVRNTALSAPFHLPLLAPIVQVRQLQSCQYLSPPRTFLSNLPQLCQAGSRLCMLADLPACI